MKLLKFTIKFDYPDGVTVKKATILALSAAIAVGAIHQFASAQQDQNQRRKAFEASKSLTKLGDYGEAVEVLSPLADAGDELALYTIGVLYATGGEGLKQDYAKALVFYQKGAEKRHAGSMRQVGVAYAKGWGVEANPTMANQWYDNAANRGDALAQLWIGKMYASGQGRTKDGAQAYKWLTLASGGIFFDDETANRDESKNSLKTLLAQLSPADLSAGEKLVRAFSAQ